MSKSARYILYAVVSLAAATLWFGPAWASGGDGGHGGLGEILFTLVIILLSAKLGGHLMERVGQPSVLGELLF